MIICLWKKSNVLRKKNTNDETIAILLAVNSLSMQLNREIEFDDKEKELDDFRRKALDDLKDKSSK